MKVNRSAHQYSGISGVVHKVLDKARRVIRFMGLRRVKPYLPSALALIPHDANSQYVGKPLEDRKVTPAAHQGQEGWVDELAAKYEGFRANNKNLNSLLEDLIQTKSGRTSTESDEMYQCRLKRAMAMSGLGQLLEDETFTSDSGRRIQRSIKPEQLETLGTYMRMRPAELYRKVISSQPHIADDVVDVGEFLVTNLRNQSVKTATEARNWYLFTRAYFDELGQELMTSTDYDLGGKKLLDYLPDIPAKLMDGEYVKAVNTSIQSLNKVKPTSAGEVQKFCKTHGIHYISGNKEVSFDAKNKWHQGLFLLTCLRNAYEANKHSAMFKADTKDPDEFERALVQKKEANELADHVREFSDRVGQNLMKKAMPESYAVPSGQGVAEENPFSYQQVLLTTNDGQCYWNSDDYQPRHGRQDIDALETFQEYQQRIRSQS
ncbi:hypothetical protein [Endozoicomonas montiporae]|nr:hypothetical protein [Endozoicomonas montiporae]AMO57082.1 hypothetical protein EZMO1_3064 [Endozoicomonas montiporae CL-33]